MLAIWASAVGTIRNIGQTTGEINDVTTAIAAAGEEQGAATREIARNVQHAAGGTAEVSSNIVGVWPAIGALRATPHSGTVARDGTLYADQWKTLYNQVYCYQLC